MRKNIHPKYAETSFTCSCGAVHQISSTMKETYSVDICSACHPVYTGKEKTIDTEGRIDRFNKKYAKN